MIFSCPVATTVSPSPNSLSNNNDQSETEPDSQVVSTTGVVSGVPSRSETATDGQISTSDANIGLIVGLAIAILVIMALLIAMVTIAAVALKKREKMKDLSSSRAVSNITYGTKGQSSIIIIMIANEINCTVIRHRTFCMIDLLSLLIIYYFLKQ